MLGGRLRVFAGRGIPLPPLRITAIGIVAGFGLGVGAGWLSATLVESYKEAGQPQATAGAITSAPPTTSVEIPDLPAITRDVTEADKQAGITTVEFPMQGEGSFTVVPGVGEEDPLAGDVRWVSVAVEDGLDANGILLRDWVIEQLNDVRGWGSGGAYQYVATDGVADFRVLLATPATAASLCIADDEGVDPSAGASDLATQGTAQPSPSPSPTEERTAAGCEQGVVVISIYDWIAGSKAFARDYETARIYQLMHGLGLAMGKEPVACVPPRADVMVDQSVELAEDCEANPWPFPDATEASPPSATPEPSAAP